MDLRHPIRAVASGLDGPVLEVLARSRRPLSTGDIARLAGVGSPSGLRTALSRLELQGLVIADIRPVATFYTANTEHLTWPAVEILAGVRKSLLEKMSALIHQWAIPPLHASAFGSFARADGDAYSDVDILIIRSTDIAEDQEDWAIQTDLLRDSIWRWTGNRGHVFELDPPRLSEHLQVADPLVDNWRRDGIKLYGTDLAAVVRDLPKDQNEPPPRKPRSSM